MRGSVSECSSDLGCHCDGQGLGVVSGKFRDQVVDDAGSVQVFSAHVLCLGYGDRVEGVPMDDGARAFRG